MHIDFLTGSSLILVSAFLVELLFYLFVTRKFIANSVKAKAKIVSVQQTQGLRTAVYTPTITFSDLAGNIYTEPAAMAGASSTIRGVSQEGDEINILYNKDNPKIFIMDSWHGKIVFTMMRSGIVLLLILVIGIIALFFI
ncbi:Protein of unknown function [Mucilaginibacter lappiensis]|uniref:DUF3592 domain-containing protein n=1 Tax=Mucilaginibacter lappiensis TaxID=354630 RepID=A0ABR6PK94_9SPHI|nr:DUF3592 domain-containing protein [Mucilaginibacter lappiensis]MBB6108661.1 hypothetical protein [Mucilaginibacter lappiensis]SIQ28881.1 Protein of unknown function [Mucilaginibacter lappiensis]